MMTQQPPKKISKILEGAITCSRPCIGQGHCLSRDNIKYEDMTSGRCRHLCMNMRCKYYEICGGFAPEYKIINFQGKCEKCFISSFNIRKVMKNKKEKEKNKCTICLKYDETICDYYHQSGCNHTYCSNCTRMMIYSDFKIVSPEFDPSKLYGNKWLEIIDQRIIPNNKETQIWRHLCLCKRKLREMKEKNILEKCITCFGYLPELPPVYYE